MNCDNFYYRDKILYMVTLALVEIRSARDFETAKALADIFHNVPSMILNDKIYEDVMGEIRDRAMKFGLVEYINNLEKSAAIWTDRRYI